MLEITGISSRVDKESPRIHGLGADARVFDISCDTNLASAPGPRHRQDAQAVKELNAKISALDLEREVYQHEDNILKNSAIMESLANVLKPTTLDEFMDSIARRKRAAMQTFKEYEEQITALKKELWVLTDANKGEISGRVLATIISKRECKAVFQLTYRESPAAAFTIAQRVLQLFLTVVTGASWTPYYDLHATTSEGRPSPKVSLLYCANITQNTGEDWTDTVLTLSTANSQALRNLSVPVLDPLKVSPQVSVQPQQAYVPAFSTASSQGGFFGHASSYPRPLPVSDLRQTLTQAPTDEPVLEKDDGAPHAPPTTVDRSPLSLSYRVEGLVILPSDGVAHKVTIAMLDFSAYLRYVCVPRKNTSAFIEATIRNTSQYELLPGPVRVFMDDGFVTKTSVNVRSRLPCWQVLSLISTIAHQR